MLLRQLLTCFLVSSGCAGIAQLTPAERKGLDDVLVLGNLNKESLKPATAVRKPGLHSMFLDDPIAALNEVASWQFDATLDRVKQMSTISETQPQTGVDPIDPAVPEPLRVPLGRLLAALSHANDEVRAASAALSADQRRDLIESLPRHGLRDPSVTLEFVRRPRISHRTLTDLMARVDLNRITRAGLDLHRAAETAAAELRPIRLQMPTLRFVHRGMPVVVSGTGNDTHDDRDAMLMVDLGGNDRYEGRFGAGIGYAAVSLDLGGDDVYSVGDANLGCGLLGVGISLDNEGDDIYRCRSLALGVGIGGFGSFVDRSGEDSYQFASGGLGFGSRGIGTMRDLSGNDDYRSESASLGAASDDGLGWFADLDGHDRYRSSRFSQGASFGGTGLQVDVAGSDIYQCQEQGTAFADGGVGLVIDVAGNDHYFGMADVQSVSTNGGVACLIDHDGDDSYTAQSAASLALAGSTSLSLICDRNGNDTYTNRGGRPARSQRGGVSVFVDSRGDDLYGAPGVSELGGIAAFADLSGADEYRRDLSDATSTLAAGVTRFDAVGSRPNPTNIEDGRMTQTPPAAEIAKAFEQALVGGAAGQTATAYLRKVGAAAFDWGIANHMDGSREVSRLLAMIGSPDAPNKAKAMALENRPGALFLCVALNVDPGAKPILAYLGKEQDRAEGIEAAGHFRCNEVAPLLLPFAASTAPGEALTAVWALSQIALPETFSTAEALLQSRDTKLRQLAIGWCAKQPADAMIAADRLTKSADEAVVRTALELLAQLGTPEALKSVVAFLEDRRPGVRIQALTALDGRVPADAQGTVARLANDTNPLVRSVAKRVRMTGG